MEWIKSGSGYVGYKAVEIKSLRIADEAGIIRRFRTCTVFKNYKTFSSMPAIARLFKDERGCVGVLVAGKNTGYVKTGKKYILRQNLIVGFNSLSKKALNSLLKGTDIYIAENDGTTVGFEK